MLEFGTDFVWSMVAGALGGSVAIGLWTLPLRWRLYRLEANLSKELKTRASQTRWDRDGTKQALVQELLASGALQQASPQPKTTVDILKLARGKSA